MWCTSTWSHRNVRTYAGWFSCIHYCRNSPDQASPYNPLSKKGKKSNIFKIVLKVILQSVIKLFQGTFTFPEQWKWITSTKWIDFSLNSCNKDEQSNEIYYLQHIKNVLRQFKQRYWCFYSHFLRYLYVAVAAVKFNQLSSIAKTSFFLILEII